MAAVDLIGFLKRLPAFIALAEAAGILKTSTGVEVAQIGADVAAVLADSTGKSPSPQLLVDAEQLLHDLKADDIVGGSVMDQSLKVAAVAKDYLAGQVAVLDANFAAFGKPGKVFAIANDSTAEAAQAFRTAIGE